MSTPSHQFTSESVSEGHPDKVADGISDALLDAWLTLDPHARVAIETLVKDNQVIVAGEVTSAVATDKIDVSAVVRQVIRDIGYNDPARRFHADGVKITNLIGEQAADIARGVGRGLDQGAGDQGLMFGFACRETPGLMPLPITLAHAITRQLAKERKSNRVPWLRPDAKSQVTVRYEGNRPVEVTDVVVSTQHAVGFDQEELKAWVAGSLLPAALGSWHHDRIKTFVNPTGVFDVGGPEGDCGVTGRKIIVDTYGGYARHGGGAFSGKDPSKVDRSAAYFARWVARQIVLHGLAETAEVQIAYAIGVARPVSFRVDTRGTGDDIAAARFAEQFDGRPGAIIERFDLLRPIYSATTNYGHFGQWGLPWEEQDYPRLVIRFMPTVYQTEPIMIRSGPPCVRIDHKNSFVQHPRPTGENGNLTTECRQLLLEGVKKAVQRTGFRMCVVWDPGHCSYVENDGSIRESNEPPSGGIKLPELSLSGAFIS